MNSYTWQDILNQVTQFQNRHLDSAFSVALANKALVSIWNFADWRETMADLPPFWLAPLLQDYGAPAAVIPDDFLGLRSAHLVQVNSDPMGRTPVLPKRKLERTHWQGFPDEISYEASVKKFRLFPLPPANMAASAYLIDGTYKKKPARITAAGLNSTLIPWDDIYQDVVYQVVLWKYLQLTGNPAAGNVQAQKGGGIVYTGQMGVAYDALMNMVEEEAINLGEETVHPMETLARGII